MIKIKAAHLDRSGARLAINLGTAIAKLSNAEVDHFSLKLIVHVLIRGSLNRNLERNRRIRVVVV
jgi:hypothetical protein